MSDATPCDNCESPCCRNYHIVIDGHDAYRISVALKLPMIEFCELRWLNEEDHNYRILLNSLPDAEVRYHRLVLKKIPDPDPRFENRCTFLLSIGEKGERGRCGIYSVRPGVCASYPTGLVNGLIGLDAGGKYCPPNSWQMANVDVPVFRVRHYKRQRHKILWDALVDAWNVQLKRESEAVGAGYFFRYLMNAYDDLSRRQPGLMDEECKRPAESKEFLVGQVGETLRSIGWPLEPEMLA